MTLSRKAPLDAIEKTGAARATESSTHPVVPPPLPITAFAVIPTASSEVAPASVVDPTTALQALELLDKLADANANVELASVEDVMDILSVVPPPLPPEALAPAVAVVSEPPRAEPALEPAAALEASSPEDALESIFDTKLDPGVETKAPDPARSESKSADETAAKATPSTAPAEGKADAKTENPEPTGAERRTTPRLRLDLEISLTSETHVFVGLTGDVSTGGVFVPTYQLKPIGSLVDIEFTLPTGLVQAKGEVRWIREQSDHSPPGIGIAFIDLPAEDRERVETFCRLRSPTYYDIDDDG